MSEPNGTSAQSGNPPADAGADAAPACDENTVNNASDTGQDALSARIETLEAELAQAREATLRVAADMENLRRRTQEDIAKAHKFASEAFAESLLSVRDALEAALAMPEMSLDSLREGVTVTLRQLESAFDKGKVTVINPVGEKFDPNVHQAVAMVPGNSVTPEVAPQHIVAVLQKGYRLHDRVLRPALVSVAQSA